MMIKNIVVVGGGTAGWLSAGLLAAEYSAGESPIKVTLIESPDVRTIGVGEGTWPTMRSTLKRIGISETAFLTRCSASFKQGSKFVGWRTGEAADAYYHPFSLPTGFGETDMHELWRQCYPDKAYDRIAGIQAAVCERQLAPKQITMPEYAGALNYGYHLDAGKFSELLREHCTERLGVSHIRDHVEQIISADNGDIARVKTREHGDLVGDLFIDCTGTHSLLLGGHYQVPFIDCSRYSANDRALAVQVPYEQEDAPIASATVGTAHSSGWSWDIGLSSRRGVGYVYSSAHIDDDSAHAELVAHLSRSVDASVIKDLSFRSLTIEAGHRDRFWVNNCVAVGMSAGFIEPLEASALALVELSVAMIRDELPQSQAAMAITARRFNDIFRYRWQRILEFLKLHYVLSERRDTAYWRDMTARDTVPPGLLEYLELWRYRAPYTRDFLHTEELFPAASYLYVLYGMGFTGEACAPVKASVDLSKAQQLFEEDERKRQKYEKAIPTNRELLNAVARYGMKKI
ncbi:tryptophan halogenase family protein [Gilvimarinus algae]